MTLNYDYEIKHLNDELKGKTYNFIMWWNELLYTANKIHDISYANENVSILVLLTINYMHDSSKVLKVKFLLKVKGLNCNFIIFHYI